MKKTPQYNSALAIVRRLRDKGFEALLAGGCVRDFVMGRDASDYDIATSALPDDVLAIFPRCIPVGRQFGVIIVVMDGANFEVATFRRDSGYQDGRRPESVTFTNAREDALRRDFTVNGMFYDPVSEEIIDFVGGRQDIDGKIIRTIGSPAERFEEDYLRMLRALRFTAKLDFAIDEGTYAEIVRRADRIHDVSMERIQEELTKMLTSAHPDRAFDLLSESGLLGRILPEAQDMKSVEQPPQFHPEGDVFEHVRLMLSLMENPSEILAYSVLLHDIGKPPTFRRATDRIRFTGHDTKGARMTDNICRRLRLPNDKRKKIVHCVGNHMRFMHVTQMRTAKLKRLMQAETFRDELELHRLDCLASHGDISNVHFLRERMEDFGQEQIKPEPLITGHDLIAMGHRPGPKFGKMLTSVETEQLESRVTTREEALAFVKKTFGSGA